MKYYMYKIHWLLRIDDLRKVRKLLTIINPRDLDVINLMDENYKIVDDYSGFLMFDRGLALDETMKYLKKAKKNEEIKYVEFLRRK